MWLRQFIGTIAFVLVGIIFIVGDVVSRVTVAPMVSLFPRRRESVLRRWVRWNGNLILAVLRAAGARLEINVRVPSEGGTLIIMNHQSLIDIPVVFACVSGGYPRMVTHYRYGRRIPLVSHMVRTYGHIPVYPGRTGRAELDRLSEIARTAQQPIVVFPEGHRTRDGEIRPWKRGALDAFLSARAWSVYVIVVDGLWRSGHITDFIRTVSTLRCRAELAGPFAYDGRGRESHQAFVDQLYGAMCAKLADMRNANVSVSSNERRAADPVSNR
jgi:1-acyl-sn-glycerol-3-phosphate acyltransferase